MRNMLQMATASLQNVLYVVLSAMLHLSEHVRGTQNRDLYLLCCIVWVCMCTYVHASHAHMCSITLHSC